MGCGASKSSVTPESKPEYKLYVANGSKYKVRFSNGESGEGEILAIGDHSEVLPCFKLLSIYLCDVGDAEFKKIYGDRNINDIKHRTSSNMSFIVTEKGNVMFGYDDLKSDWKWFSTDDNGVRINHRPTKSFVANASGGEIKVKPNDRDNGFVSIKPGETATIEYEDITIKSNKDYNIKPKPRTSTVVLGDNYKVTGQLYGENIEEAKWRVDGENYKPKGKIENITGFIRAVAQAVEPVVNFWKKP